MCFDNLITVNCDKQMIHFSKMNTFWSVLKWVCQMCWVCVRCVECVSDVLSVCQMCWVCVRCVECVCQMCWVCIRCVECVSDVLSVCQMCWVCVRCVECVCQMCWVCVRCVESVSDVLSVCQMCWVCVRCVECWVCQMCWVCVRCVECVSDALSVCQMRWVCVRCVECVSDALSVCQMCWVCVRCVACVLCLVGWSQHYSTALLIFTHQHQITRWSQYPALFSLFWPVSVHQIWGFKVIWHSISCKGCVYSAGVSGVTVVTQSPLITVSKGETAELDCNLGTVTDSVAGWYKQTPGRVSVLSWLELS